MYRLIEKKEALKASKFLKQQFFVPVEILKDFFSHYPHLVYVPVGKIIEDETLIDSTDGFLKSYATYQNRILSGETIEVNDIRGELSGAISLSTDAFGFQQLQNSRRIYQPILPVLQFQLLSFVVGIDKKIHFSFGKEVTYLGLQILYPQLFIDAEHKVKNGLKEQESPNATLYKDFVSFLREHTQLLQFNIDGNSIRSQIRIHPEIFEKIKMMPSFIKLGIKLC